MSGLTDFTQRTADLVWGTPLVSLLLGGGVFFLILSRAIPYRRFGHGLAVLMGRYDTPDAVGEISHKQALAAALSNTMGLGNIAGVALAIVAGGPGAVFWMWISAIVGIATKFFTCSLGVMYRGTDSLGNLQGGPMYVIREALPKPFYPLAVLFALAGLIGTLPMFQANQLTALIQDAAFDGNAPAWAPLLIGVSLAGVVGSVIFGGLPRVANVAITLLPTMVIVYLLMTAWVVINHLSAVPGILLSIVSEALSPTAVGGGFLGVMLIGISRGAFSNEAGVGTEVMAHGAAKTNEPIREGMLATLGPVFDTLIVCTCTAIVILLSGNWQQPGELSGITLTANAFHGEMGGLGARAARVCRADTEHHHHVYRLVLRRQMFWVFSRRAVAALLSLVLCPRGHIRRDGEYRCGLQSDLGELRADGDPHHDQLYRAGPESGRSEPRLFRGALQ